MKYSHETHLEKLKIKVYEFNELLVGVATDIGPRILYLALRSKPEKNIFGILPKAGVQTEDGYWNMYGGHRLWSSPEAMPRSYSMDQQPVHITKHKDQLVISGNPEPLNSIQKELIITENGKHGINVTHKIHNIGRWPLRLACWGITVMQKGGFAVLPVYPQKVDLQGLLPDRPIVLWPYTQFSDERLVMKGNFIFLVQVPSAPTPVKIGTRANPSKAFYCWGNLAFSKEIHTVNQEYPDYGSTFEAYTNGDMLELETLGPLTDLLPGEMVEHTEVWNLREITPLTIDPKTVAESLFK